MAMGLRHKGWRQGATQGSGMARWFSLQVSLRKHLLWIGCAAAAASIGVGVSASARIEGRSVWRGSVESLNAEQSAQDGAAGGRSTRGKKLVLKDGTFQLVRDYERNGDRVRYFSLERGSWEYIPSAMW